MTSRALCNQKAEPRHPVVVSARLVGTNFTPDLLLTLSTDETYSVRWLETVGSVCWARDTEDGYVDCVRGDVPLSAEVAEAYEARVAELAEEARLVERASDFFPEGM